MPQNRVSCESQLESRWIRSWADWWMLARVLCLTILVRGLLSIWSLSDVSRWLKKTARRFSSRTQGNEEGNEAYRERAAWAANAVGHRLLPKRPCLTQALVLQYILLRGGDELAQLHIGVAKEDEELQAHAWVERTDKVLIGGTASPHKYERFGDLEEKIGPVEPGTAS